MIAVSKRTVTTLALALFMIATYGMGYYYNEVYRMGNLFISDCFLLFIIVIPVLLGECSVEKKTFLIILIAIFQFMNGVLFGNGLGNVFRDLKIYLYFWGVYWYVKKYKKVYSVRIIRNILILCLILSLLLNWLYFFQNGITQLSVNGQIGRSFSIGMGFEAATFMSILLRVKKKSVPIWVYYLLQIFFLASVIISYTRTQWIIYGVATVLQCIIIVAEKKGKFNSNRMIATLLASLLIVLCFISFLNNSNITSSSLYQSIAGRFESLETAGEGDTLEDRFSQLSSSLYKLESPRIIWGYGFGDTRINPKGFIDVKTENSIFYYVWKYGIVLAVILFFRTFRLLKNKIFHGTYIEKSVWIYFLCSLIIGAFSGMESGNYSLCIYAFYFSFDWENAFGKNGWITTTTF